MNAVQQLYRVPAVAATMRELSKEMMRAGILEEMMEDTFEGMEDQDELEAEAEEEIDNVRVNTFSKINRRDIGDSIKCDKILGSQVLWEVTAGQIGRAPAAGSHELPSVSTEKTKVTPAPVSDEEDELELEQMRNRLQALKS